jgi:ParB-like chromosome segregation protein Spo0J
VPALVRDGGAQLDDAISENVQRHDLNPIEEARALEPDAQADPTDPDGAGQRAFEDTGGPVEWNAASEDES